MKQLLAARLGGHLCLRKKEATTLIQKALAVHSAGRSGKADTTIISSMPDTNTGSTYDEYLNEISQDLKKCEERGSPLN